MNLTEHFWRPATDPARTHALLAGIEEPEQYDRAYAVTVGAEGPAILVGCGDPVPTGGTPFADHLRRHPPTGLWDAAFVTDAFVLPDPMYAPAERLNLGFAPSRSSTRCSGTPAAS